jgi:hypothetical protein
MASKFPFNQKKELAQSSRRGSGRTSTLYKKLRDLHFSKCPLHNAPFPNRCLLGQFACAERHTINIINKNKNWEYNSTHYFDDVERLTNKHLKTDRVN